ncbi:hypothetical protein HP532_08880 [Pseudomonas sp. CrR25]|nr:hypothetical protein [Pseudomonas sp. CrR25]
MTLRRWPYLHNLAVLLGLALLLGACTRLDLAYRNLDWLVPWRLNRYLHLDREQQAWLRPRLQAHLDWHCSSELPRYLDWLDRTDTLLAQAQPDAVQLATQLAAVDEALKRIAVQITPTAVELLQSLTPHQVAELHRVLEEDNRELHVDFLEPPLAVQIVERAERLEERLRPWLGRLNDDQRARIGQWAARLGEQNRLWLDNRLRWQAAFRTALEARRSADFPIRLSHLLQAHETFYDTDYRATYQRSRQALAELLSDLLASADASQRERLTRHLHELRRDLAEQLCAAPAPRG